MKTHIGKLIGLRLEQTGMSKAEFARRIHRSPQNIQDLLTRASVDTALLTVISRVLSYNFFNAFIQPEEVLKDLKKKELNGFIVNTDLADGKSKKDGKAPGKPDGKADGKSDGKSDGKADGKADGKSDGKSDGKTGNEPKISELQKTLQLLYAEQEKMRVEILKLKRNK